VADRQTMRTITIAGTHIVTGQLLKSYKDVCRGSYKPTSIYTGSTLADTISSGNDTQVFFAVEMSLPLKMRTLMPRRGRPKPVF